eukprot:gene17279-23593_t
MSTFPSRVTFTDDHHSSLSYTIWTSPHTSDGGGSDVVVQFGDILWDLVDDVCKLQTYDNICRTQVFNYVSSVYNTYPHARYGLSMSSLIEEEDTFDMKAILSHCLENSGGAYFPAEDMVVFPTFDNFFRGVLELVEEIAKHSRRASAQERWMLFKRFFKKACSAVDMNDVSDLLEKFSIGCTRDC